jgi:hypothetical protein
MSAIASAADRKEASYKVRAVRRAAQFLVDSRLGLVATAAAWAIFIAIFLLCPFAQQSGNSDGHYEWLYARSLAYDYDVDFANDYALCGDPFGKGVDAGNGHPDNPYYMGPAVVLAPLLWTLRHTTTLPAGASPQDRAACTGPLVTESLFVAPALGALIVWLMYRIGRRFAPDGPAALAAGLLGLGSQLPCYAGLGTSFTHVYDAFWAALIVIASLRASERPRSALRWALAGICVGVGILQRPVSVVYGVIPATLAATTLWRQWRALIVALALLGAGAFVCGVLPQSLLYKFLYGAYFITSPGRYRFFMQYGHAHPWLLLFAPHGGLFYSAPAAWVAVPGLFLALFDRRTRPLAASLLVAAGAATWLSSAALDWYGSGTFGARRLTSILPLLAAPAAIALERARRWLRARPSRAATALGVAVLVPLAFTFVGAVLAMARGRIPTDVGSSQAGLYGQGDEAAWQTLDERFGDVTILPAEIAFSLRYGLSMNAFRDATEPLIVRNFVTMGWEMHDIDLVNGQHANLITGFSNAADGAHLRGRRGTVVFASQWPFATELAVTARAAHPVRVRVGRALAFGRTEVWGELPVDSSMQPRIVPIPPGSFDSGIFAIAIGCDDSGADLVVNRIRVEDTTSYPPQK